MEQKTDHPLKAVATRVLEDWGLMLVDNVEQENAPFKEEEKLYMAWVDVHGPIDGALSIVAQHDFIKQLACNLLGSDDEEGPSDEECKDALKEMSNVLAGNFFTEAYGDNVVFEVINPTVSEVSSDELDKIAKRRVKFYFLADELPVAISYGVK